jgi:hypothetical protein
LNILKDYEFRAQECEALARLSLPEHKLPILQMAEMWRRMAKERQAVLEAQKAKTPDRRRA